MNAQELFVLGHAALHERTLPGAIERLTPEEMRARPAGLNSVAWILWHIARCEDVGINRFVLGRPQMLDDGGWMDRMRVPIRQYGTGMTSEEVTKLSVEIDLEAAHAYRAAVAERTREMIPRVQSERLCEIVDEEERRRVHEDEGVCGPNAGWVRDPARGGRTRAWYMLHLGLTHSVGHVYEAMATCALLGKPGR